MNEWENRANCAPGAPRRPQRARNAPGAPRRPQFWGEEMLLVGRFSQGASPALRAAPTGPQCPRRSAPPPTLGEREIASLLRSACRAFILASLPLTQTHLWVFLSNSTLVYGRDSKRPGLPILDLALICKAQSAF